MSIKRDLITKRKSLIKEIKEIKKTKQEYKTYGMPTRSETKLMILAIQENELKNINALIEKL